MFETNQDNQETNENSTKNKKNKKESKEILKTTHQAKLFKESIGCCQNICIYKIDTGNELHGLKKQIMDMIKYKEYFFQIISLFSFSKLISNYK